MSEKVKTTITENTSITLGLVITLAGGIFWLSTMSSGTQANTKAIEEIKVSQRDDLRFQREVIERLSRIEARLENHRSSR